MSPLDSKCDCVFVWISLAATTFLVLSCYSIMKDMQTLFPQIQLGSQTFKLGDQEVINHCSILLRCVKEHQYTMIVAMQTWWLVLLFGEKALPTVHGEVHAEAHLSSLSSYIALISP